MARPLRIEYPDAWYHIMNRGRRGEQIFTEKSERIRRYRQYISTDDEELNKVFEKKKWPSILGSEKFLNLIKEKFFMQKTDDEVPQSKGLAPDTDMIKNIVCKHYQITLDNLLQSRRGFFNEPRNVAIYITRRLRGDSLKKIGNHYRINKYSSVSSVIERMKAQINQDRGLRKRVEKLLKAIGKSQEQT